MANVPVANTSASLSGKTLATLEGSQTVTGAKTFDLGASAPFNVVSGAAKVSNLDADKLDGEEGTAFHNAALLTGVLPATAVGADPNADRIVFWDDSAGAFAYLVPVNAMPNGTNFVLPHVDPRGRLTLTSGTPVTTADVTAAGTLYWAPYKGNTAQLYNATTWETFALAELSIAVPAVANQVYDVFLNYNAGVPALALTAWTNDTTRATALTTQDGRLVKTGSTGQLYVGTVRTVTASQLNDSLLLRHVWNYFNRIPRTLQVTDATASWTYTTATVRQARGSAANQVDVVIGVAEVPIDLALYANGINDTGATDQSVGIGEDSTTTYAAGAWWEGSSSVNMAANVRLCKYPTIGRHFYSWNEWSEAIGTSTWYGTNTKGGSVASGLRGSILG